MKQGRADEQLVAHFSPAPGQKTTIPSETPERKRAGLVACLSASSRGLGEKSRPLSLQLNSVMVRGSCSLWCG